MPYEYEITQLQSPDFPWQIVAYVFANGIAAGAFIIAALMAAFGGNFVKAGLHRAYYISFIASPICGLLLIGKLQIKSRFINVLWNSRDGVIMFNPNSPMSIGGWVLSVFAVFATIGVIYAIGKDGWIQWKWFGKLVTMARFLHEGVISKGYLLLGSVVAGWFASYIGILVTTTHLPPWNATPLIPVLWIVSAMALGASTVILLLLLSKNNQNLDLINRINRIVGSMVVLNIIVIVAFVIGLGQWSYAVNSGHYGILLWGVAVVLGLLVPLILIMKPAILGRRKSLITSSVLILLGGLALRYVVLMGPQAMW